jgi:ElaB/YqjD/DUF883 family membrane-anchored ribosome-binding protein
MTQQNERPSGSPLESPSMYEPQDRGPGSYSREYQGRDFESEDERRYQGRDGGGSTGTMDKARDQVNTMKDQATDRVEEGRERVAEGTHQAAEKLREQAEERGGMQGKVGLKAADTMEQAAGYLRDHKTDEMWSDFERYAKEHPMQAVGGAVVAGFLLGRILR